MDITANYIEILAEKVLAKAEVTAPAVETDRIAEFVCDLVFDWINLDKLSREGEVLAAISVRDKKIYMNESKKYELKRNPGRMNFTVAHELGHWFLHKDSAQEKLAGFEGSVLICRSVDRPINDKERQANLFATYLLMPKKFIVEELNSMRTYLEENDLRQMANKFRVSKQAMEIRLVKELKLLYAANGRYYKSELAALEARGQQSLFS